MSETRGSLGLVQATALYVGAVLGTGVLVLPAIAAETAGPASLIAWVTLIALSVPMALTYAAMSTQRPDAAGFSDAIERAFGTRWGAASGWILLAAIPPGFPVAMLIAGGSAATAFGLGRDASFVFAALLMATVLGVNFAGLRVSATAQSISIATITLVILVVIARATPRVDPAAFTPFFPHGEAAVGLAAVQLFWAFVGWEAITPLAAEVRRVSDIWRATIIAVVIVAAFYVALAVVTIGAHAYGTTAGQVPLVTLAADTFGPQAGAAVGVLAFAITFPVANAYTAGLSRLAAALARRRALPVWLGPLDARGVPRRSLAVLAAVGMGALLVAYVTDLRIADLLAPSNSAFIATYVLSMAAAMRLLRGPLRVGAAISLVACVVVFVFTGGFVLWIAGVTALSLIYTARSMRTAPAAA
jgi:amino acid efflux transporter